MSPRMCLLLMTSYAPPYALRVMTVSFGHRRLAVGVQQLRAVADDPAVFLVDAGQEPGHVDERDQRDVEAVAGPDEPRRLDRRVDVERAGQDRRLLRDDADAAAAEPREADDDVLRPARLDLEERRRRRRSRSMTSCMSYGWRGSSGTIVSSAASRRSDGIRRSRRAAASSRLFCGRYARIRARRVERRRLVRRREVRDAAASSCGSSRRRGARASTSSWVTAFTTFGPVTNM